MANILTIGKLKELKGNGLIDFLIIKNIKLDDYIIGYYVLYLCEKLGIISLYRFKKNEEVDKYIQSYDIGLYRGDGSELYHEFLKYCEI